MLDCEYTRTPRYFPQDKQGTNNALSGIPAYRFFANILAVNRTIHDEAEELMYKRNTFVVISHQSMALRQVFGGLLWVPMVSKEHTGRMKLHSLRIHLAVDKAGLPVPPMQSFIILAEGLEPFSCAARVTTAEVGDPGPAVTVKFQSGTSVIGLNESARNGKKVGPSKILCDLRETKFRPMDERLQHRLLTPFASIISSSQRTVFKGAICNPQEIEHLKQVMSPTIFCAEASLLWELETCMLAKEVADAARHHDSLEYVMALQILTYRRLSTLVSETGIVLWAQSNFPKGLEWIETFLLEVLMNIACAHLKLNNVENFCFWLRETHIPMDKLTARLDSQTAVPSGIRAYYASLILWSHLYTGDFSSLTVGDAVGQLRSMETEPHQQHDLNILERYPDYKANFTKEVLPFDQCSISQLPCPATSFYKTMDGLEQSTRFKGWHNVECIRSLDKDTKRAINALQKKHGLLVTDFDLAYVG